MMPGQVPSGPRLYRELAWLWPILSPVDEYAEEARELLSLIREHSRRPVQTLLHMGCGGGHLDYHLNRSLQVTGVDTSLVMLDLARKRNPEVLYRQGDMRTLDLGEAFDAVLIADSIEYMTTRDDLEAAFRTAYQHLAPGGVFCTYAEVTRERFVQNKTQVTTREHEELVLTSIENSYDPDPADTSYELTFIYLIRQAGELSIEVDQHRMGLFPVGVWVGALEAVGFEVQVIPYQDAGPAFLARRD